MQFSDFANKAGGLSKTSQALRGLPHLSYLTSKLQSMLPWPTLKLHSYVLRMRAEMVCPSLNAPVNGYLEGTDLSFGNTIIAGCHPGFMFPDGHLTKELECIAIGNPKPDAVWSNVVEDCERMYRASSFTHILLTM